MSMNLEHWQITEPVSLFVSDGENEQEYRLTFGTCSNLDIGLFNRRRGRVFEAMRKTYGDDWIGNDEAMVLQGVMVSHAMIMAGLKRVEVRTGDIWADTRLPDAWYDAERFAREVPAGLTDTLAEAVIAAGNHPRLFALTPIGDDEKKVLRLTVTPSAS